LFPCSKATDAGDVSKRKCWIVELASAILRSWRKRGWVEGKAKLKMVDHWAEMGGVASHDIKNMPLSVFSSIVAFVPIRTQDTDQAGRKFAVWAMNPDSEKISK